MDPSIVTGIVFYGIGVFIWYGYAINRFGVIHIDDPAYYTFHLVVAFLWPIALALYVPYRIFRAVGVNDGCNCRR